MLEARPAGLDRLGGERAAPLEDGERRHHREPYAGVGEHLIDGVEAALEDERVEGRLGQQDVDAPFDERLDLLAVGRHHLVERHVAVARVGDVARDGELLVRRADRSRDESRPVGGRGHGRVGRLAGQPRRGKVELPHPVGQAEVGQRHARRAERVGLDDVGAGGQIGGVDVPDRVPLREDQDVDAVLQVARVVAERGPAKPTLVQSQGVHHRAHRPVQDNDTLGQQVEQGRGAVCGGGHAARCWTTV